MNLSKSDFQLASNCSQKLLYKKRGYPISNDSNEYMKMLAEGGYVVGHMATMLYQEGVEITGTTAEALLATQVALEQENCVLFEAAVSAGQKLVRIDILVKEGTTLHLIEVKSKSHSSEDDKSAQVKDLKKYIEDVAYQYLVLSEAYQEMNIKCSLLLPDKSKRTAIDGLAGWFSIQKDDREDDVATIEIPTQNRPRFRKPIVKVQFEDHPERETKINQLKNDGILSYLDVTDEVEKIKSKIEIKANELIEVLNIQSAEGKFKINKNCKNCEFRTPGETLNGFNECWGETAYADPHIFDLYHGGSIRSAKNGFYLDELIENGKSSMADIEIERLKNTKGEMGTHCIRQMIQLEYTKRNEEWISHELKSISGNFKYPLHFVDFETYLGAIPFHASMRPYELIAFQWSLHTIEREGAEPIHNEWLHDSNEFPNFEFASSLKDAIGNTGTPFMWATHENTVLRTILHQMETYGHENEELKEWLIRMTHDKSSSREGRLVDMNKMTLEHYFHPEMKGKTSIKKVLPAIWGSHPYLHQVPHFSEYKSLDEAGKVIDPYDLLAVHVEEDTGDEVVKVGTAAMRAYYRYRFDSSLANGQAEEIRKQLMAYCKLDTLSMVMIAHHWGIK